ncbi:MAG TPA: hypothetical protein P5338_03220 [Bacteroidales bacterium]|nr:hypothetical protein [Bacteroidales bacterium]
MKDQKSLVVALILITMSLTATAQISLAPSFVFLDANTGVGNLYISNNGTQAQEVTISFLFGYPGSDSEGNLVMRYDDSAAFKQYGLDSMIRAFPRSFTLNGGEQRTVRIQVIPAAQQKDGFFFTRLKVLAKPLSAEVSQQTTEGISTRISFNFEQITAVFYHKGKVRTGLKVEKTETFQKEKQLEVRAHLVPQGNAPYIGSMFAKIKDNQGKVLAESEATTTAYFPVIRNISLNTEGIAPGTYTLELCFETRRNDMAATDLVQAPRIVHETQVMIR